MVMGNVDRWLDDASSDPRPGSSVLLLVVTAGMILAVIGGFLAWRGYQDRAERARELVVQTASEAARATGQFFDDRVAVLEAITGMSALQGSDLAVMAPVLEAIAAETLGFRGGAGWVDADGLLQIATGTPAARFPIDLSDRNHVRQVLATADPYITHALSGVLTGERVLALAVPTFQRGEVSGVLVAWVLVEDLLRQVPALAPPRVEMRVIDRSGQIILENGRPVPPEPPANIALVQPEAPSSLVGTGLQGDSDRIIGIARVERPSWGIVVEQSRVMALAGARTRLFAEIGIVVALLVLTSGAAFVAAQRLNASHGQLTRRTRDLGILDRLAAKMAAAAEPRDVALSALDVFAEVFGSPKVAMGLVADGEMRVFEADRESGITESVITLSTRSILVDSFHTGKTMILDSAEYRRQYQAEPDGRRSESAGAIAVRFSGRVSSGAISLMIPERVGLSPDDIALFESMVLLLPGSLGRSVATERERMASRIFQQALLPKDNIGLDVVLQRAVRYLPAVGDVEVGGDWYDLWTIGEDTIGAVVGDVVGRGVEAAAAMGQLRSALRATVATADSAGEALAYLDDMTRHITGSPSATVLLGSLDLGSGVVTMASAGHLPPLIATADEVRVIYEVRGAPIGFLSQPTKRPSVAIKLRPEETLVLYTDGLVERRDETIDRGIARLADALRASSQLPLERLADSLVEACIEPGNSDDIALVCVRLVGDIAQHFTCVVDPADFEEVVEVLRKWLKAHEYPETAVEEVLARVSDAVAVVLEVTDSEQPGEVMIEIDRSEGTSVTLEHRRRTGGSGRANTDAFILRRWPESHLGPRGPRMGFSITGGGSVKSEDSADH